MTGPDPLQAARDVARICRTAFTANANFGGQRATSGPLASTPDGAVFDTTYDGVAVTVRVTVSPACRRPGIRARLARRQAVQSAVAGRDAYVAGGDAVIIRDGH